MTLLSTGAVLNKSASQLGIVNERTNKRASVCFNFSFPEGLLAKKRGQYATEQKSLFIRPKSVILSKQVQSSGITKYLQNLSEGAPICNEG